jgi:hypothetical protein
VPALSVGHHDALSQFDIEAFIELEGEVTEVRWTYPHVLITIDVIGENGIESWSLQTQDPSVLRQLGISESPLLVGDNVRTYGWAPRSSDQHESFVFNLLLPSGEELVLERGGPYRLSK